MSVEPVSLGVPAHFGLWRSRGGRLPADVLGPAGDEDPAEALSTLRLRAAAAVRP